RLLHGWPGRIEGQPVPTRVRLLRANQVDQFVRETLLNPGRVLPVVLLALDGPLKFGTDALQTLQEQLLGLAVVAALLDRAAGARLKELLGPERSCEGGVLRTYWPGFSREAPPSAHPLQTYDELRQTLGGGALDEHLLGVLAGLSTACFRDGRLAR